jgi:hypothetical protein
MFKKKLQYIRILFEMSFIQRISIFTSVAQFLSNKNFTYAKCQQLFAEEINEAEYIFSRSRCVVERAQEFLIHTHRAICEKRRIKKRECKESKQILTSLCERVWES